MARKTFFASSGPVDQVGEAFMVLGQVIRRCLVCDETFTRQAAAAETNSIVLNLAWCGYGLGHS
jgi:hypothetical protein